MREYLYTRWWPGDTVHITTDRWHTRWRDRILYDSIYIAQRDTVTVTTTGGAAKLSWQMVPDMGRAFGSPGYCAGTGVVSAALFMVE